MGQLCDAGCVVTFDATSVIVTLDDERILDGVRTPSTGLWNLSMVTPSLAPSPLASTLPPALSEPPCLHQSFTAVQSATPPELVAFAHATLFSPALSALRKALDRGFLPNFPGITAATLKKYPPKSVAMIKGHLDQERKNQKSTKPSHAAAPTQQSDDSDTANFPNSDLGNSRTHFCYAAIVDPSNASGQIHSDQTGKFVVASSTGNNYVMVVYDYDSNAIMVEPMRSRTDPCILAAFQVLHTRLVAAGLRPPSKEPFLK